MVTYDMASYGPSTTALLCIDLQNDFCDPSGAFARRGMCLPDADGLFGRVNQLIYASRARGLPVFWARMVYDSDDDLGLLAARGPGVANGALRRGSWGAEVDARLRVEPGDEMVDKTRFSAFYRTDLESRLRARHIEHLLVAGVRTDYCVESTVRDAFFRDFRVTVATDAVSGFDGRFEQLHRNSLQVMGTVFAEIRPTEDICRALGGDDQRGGT